MPAIESAVRDSLTSGVLAGYPLVDLAVALVGGSYDVDLSSEEAYQRAAAMAFRKANEEAHPVLLEPIMRVEVVVPEDRIGDVIGDLNARRGEIEGIEVRPGGMQAIRGHVPLGGDVRVRHIASLGYPGTRRILDGVRLLCPGSIRCGQEDSGRGKLWLEYRSGTCRAWGMI